MSYDTRMERMDDWTGGLLGKGICIRPWAFTKSIQQDPTFSSHVPMVIPLLASPWPHGLRTYFHTRNALLVTQFFNRHLVRTYRVTEHGNGTNNGFKRRRAEARGERVRAALAATVPLSKDHVRRRPGRVDVKTTIFLIMQPFEFQTCVNAADWLAFHQKRSGTHPLRVP